MYFFLPESENCGVVHYSKFSLGFAVTSTWYWPHQPQQGIASFHHQTARVGKWTTLLVSLKLQGSAHWECLKAKSSSRETLTDNLMYFKDLF